jgi:hypothetical protein
MRGVIPPLPTSWRGAQVKAQGELYLHFYCMGNRTGLEAVLPLPGIKLTVRSQSPY